MSAVTEINVVRAIVQENNPISERKTKCMGHHWKMVAITLAPSMLGIGLGIGGIITGLKACERENYYISIACVAFSLALALFACVQMRLYCCVRLERWDDEDPKSFCNEKVYNAALIMGAIALLVGVAGGMVLGLAKQKC